jgi:putative transposase
LHVVQRGNNRAACLVDDADRLVYLAMLEELARCTRCAVHAYVLMTNHVHLLLTPDSPPATSSLMQRLGMRFAAYVNRRHARSGTLWEGRFRAGSVASMEHVLACHRYIELNPVRAGIVEQPDQYRWSSHAANTGRAGRGFLTTHVVLSGLGHSPEAAAGAYRSLFDVPLDDSVVTTFRQGMSRPGSDLNLTPVQAVVN